ncbi:MAG TPA: TrbI/VirB10 family protein [Bryobacteraceae bacterium]|jgi:type IV secretion system protein VirB10
MSDQERPAVAPITAPTGIDLHPAPRPTVHISKRAGITLLALGALLLFGFAWAGYRRSLQKQASAREAGLPKTVTPAHADDQLLRSIPLADASVVHQASPPPSATPGPPEPQTAQSLPRERVVVRQAPQRIVSPAISNPPTPPPAPPEDHTLADAWQLEHEAMMAPTAIKSGSGVGMNPKSVSLAAPAATDQVANLAAIGRALGLNPATAPNAGTAPLAETDYEAQNEQTRKAAFFQAARNRSATEDYLRYTREAPLSRFEIKAGWEIPAVLEQSLNSDLSGELKALVTANVYDTATGQYLLIPQGARLIGNYDSRVSYGQDGVQVVWNRIIFPDASSIDLGAMMGLDSHGNAGLRDKVDHHYRRLIGTVVLSSMFMAAFAISQNGTQSVLAYPTPTQAAEASIGQELSQTGAQLTRRNINVQPTIKVPAGYRFNVRVNRDILFEAPYQPVLPPPEPEGLPQRSAFSARR